MAERRMFAKTIIDSDAFLDMPLSAQALYFHLSMRADDEGFVNNPRKIQRVIGASDDDCRLLIAKRFILTFESGVIVIKHWRIHNYIAKDRFKETVYQEEKAMLELSENNAYTEKSTECIQDVYRTETQDRIEKESKVKDRIETPTLAEIKSFIKDNDLIVDAERFYNHYSQNGWKVGSKKIDDWKAVLMKWDSEDRKKAPRKPKVETKETANYDLSRWTGLEISGGGM